jgi:serine/threonine protein kinase
LLRCMNSLRMRSVTTLWRSKLLYWAYINSRICKGGELFDEIIARGKFTEKDAAVLMKQVLSCVNYCHKMHIVHR